MRTQRCGQRIFDHICRILELLGAHPVLKVKEVNPSLNFFSRPLCRGVLPKTVRGKIGQKCPRLRSAYKAGIGAVHPCLA